MIADLIEGARVRVTLANGDTFGLRIESTALARRTSFALVTFSLTGDEGILFTRPNDTAPLLIRHGWARPHRVSAIKTLSVPACDPEDEPTFGEVA